TGQRIVAGNPQPERERDHHEHRQQRDPACSLARRRAAAVLQLPAQQAADERNEKKPAQDHWCSLRPVSESKARTSRETHAIARLGIGITRTTGSNEGSVWSG